MDEHLSVNQRMWDEWTDIHIGSDFYAVDAFLQGESSLRDVERRELGDVKGKSLLHLQCHFGMDTMSWTREGARATGIDFSPRAIELARELATKLALDTDFVCSDIYGLPEVLHETYDIVFTSYGVLTWLPDLDRWAEVIYRFLKPGGTFYIVEQHPAGGIYRSDDPTRVGDTYFRDEAAELHTTVSYADSNAPTTSEKQYQWRHPLGRIITALTSKGLHVEFLHEFPYSQFKRYSTMEQRADGWWYLPDDNVPMLFSLKATKPAS